MSLYGDSYFMGKMLDELSDEAVEYMRLAIANRMAEEAELAKRGIITRWDIAMENARQWLRDRDQRKAAEKAAAQASLLL